MLTRVGFELVASEYQYAAPPVKLHRDWRFKDLNGERTKNAFCADEPNIHAKVFVIHVLDSIVLRRDVSELRSFNVRRLSNVCSYCFALVVFILF